MTTSIENSPTTIKMVALGLLLAALMAAFSLAAKPAHASTTFTVNSTADYGDQTPGDGKCHTGTIMLAGETCTLRAAIQEANATTGADTINFNIPTTGVATISPAPNELPAITGPLTINGYSQPGAEPNQKAVGSDAVLKIELSGAKVFGSGLRIEAQNSTVKGLVINQWSTAGIWIDGSGAKGNKVTGNYIGTDASGTQDLGTSSYGVAVDGANNTVGGTTPAERNVISGSDFLGVLFEDSGAGGNKVMGNYIGTDASGTKDLGNASHGISIDDVPNNTIGGTTTGARNVISGNDGQGVAILGNQGNKITGNYVGTDATGTRDLGNTYHGVYIDYGKDNTIGGTTAGERNVISGNAGSGLSIYGDTATGNRILSNSIFSNGGLGIDLGDDGPTTNDPDDVDTGPNYLQNFPVLSSARKGAAGTTTVRGKLNSTPNSTFRVQFFSNPKGTYEGKTLLGSINVSTNGAGDASFAFATKKTVKLDQNITATATGVDGTSEFSAPRKVVAQ